MRKPALLQATDFTFSGLRDLQSWLIGPQFGFWGVGVQTSSSYLTKMFVEGLLSEWSFVLLPNYDVGQWFERESCELRLAIAAMCGCWQLAATGFMATPVAMTPHVVCHLDRVSCGLWYLIWQSIGSKIQNGTIDALWSSKTKELVNQT